MSKFQLGQIVATPGCLEEFQASGQEPGEFLQRHVQGDWGPELDPEDRQSNEDALVQGLRILSEYRLNNGTVIWIVSEADRSSTTLLLPEEY